MLGGEVLTASICAEADVAARASTRTIVGVFIARRIVRGGWRSRYALSEGASELILDAGACVLDIRRQRNEDADAGSGAWRGVDDQPAADVVRALAHAQKAKARRSQTMKIVESNT